MSLYFYPICISKLTDFGVKYEWYNVGVKYSLDLNAVKSVTLVSCSLPHSYLLTAVTCIALAVVGILILYSFFPTGTVDSMMYERNEKGSDVTSGVNLLCCNAFKQSGHCGTFVYDYNDPSGQYIRGLFYLGRPVTASVNNRSYVGYIREHDHMWRKYDRNLYDVHVPMVSQRSMGSMYETPGEVYVISNYKLQQLKTFTYVDSGNLHLVPAIPVYNYHITGYKLSVHIRCFTAAAFING